jgi:phosphopantothenate-cysteine ligase
MDPENYFSTTTPPAGLTEISKLAQEFIDFNTNNGRPIALVTSGGTTVPLEAQTVRFLDNFSAGTRGATSAEYFIEQGYACIFLHRQWSLEPYTRHYTHSTNCFLDLLQEKDGNIVVSNAHTVELQKVLHLYQRVHFTN